MEPGGGCGFRSSQRCLVALTAIAPAFYFHKHSAKGNTLQRNYQGHGRVASHSTKTVLLRSELLNDFLLPTSPGPPCVEFIWNHYQRIWRYSLYCVAVRGGKRQKTQAEGVEGRVTNCPSWPRLCSTKSPASRKTPPSQANQDNCSTSKGRERKRQTLPKPGVLSHSTLLVMENPTQEALLRVSLLQTAVSPRW